MNQPLANYYSTINQPVTPQVHGSAWWLNPIQQWHGWHGTAILGCRSHIFMVHFAETFEFERWIQPCVSNVLRNSWSSAGASLVAAIGVRPDNPPALGRWKSAEAIYKGLGRDHPELMDKIELMFEPASNVDSIILTWAIEAQAHQYPCSVWMRDCFFLRCSCISWR